MAFGLDYVAAGLILAWLLLSVIGQMPCELTQRLRALDMAGLIPNWSFFAPIPGTCDYFLLYRDELTDRSLTDWREITLCDDRQPLHIVWNPRKREKKALFDLTTALVREARTDAIDAVQLSVPYLILITYISSLPRAYPTRSTQFLLMMTDELSVGLVPVPLFTSAFHLL